MSLSPSVRVAALQFGAGVDIETNKSKTLAMIDRASAYHPDLMVLPEFCNHASWYDSQEHCYNVSLDLNDSTFLKEVAMKARQYQCYLVINVTLQRDEGQCTGSSILFDRQGEILAVSDKQVLMGHENDFLQKAQQVSPVVETDIGRLGLYSCMDGVIAETPRSLALRGADILCNSLNSFAFDEASLHIPVRAAENKVFVVAANKVGALIPEEMRDMVAQAIHIPAHFLSGAGESQIIAPDGTVICKASLTGEDIVFADIQVEFARNKLRPDGSDIFANRRPELYQSLGNEPKSLKYASDPKPLRVACWQGSMTQESAIHELCLAIPELAKSHDIVVLPELFFAAKLEDLSWGLSLDLSSKAIKDICQALEDSPLLIAGSFLQEAYNKITHETLLLSGKGIVHRQAQVHRCHRYGEQIELGHSIEVMDLGFTKLAMLTGEDAIYPELYRIIALEGADLVLISGHVQECWELETGLLERASENRICLAYASRPGVAGASLLADLDGDFTLLTPWDKRSFDGNISKAQMKRAPRYPGVCAATLHGERAQNKQLSGTTHLLDSRPWHLMSQFEKSPQGPAN